MEITSKLVKQLIEEQFPQWKKLSIQPVKIQGHDHRTFLLGDTMTVRLPSATAYEGQIEKEWQWLPLMKQVSIPTTKPIALGKASEVFPHPWIIHSFLNGQTIREANILPTNTLAMQLGTFLNQLRQLQTTNGPLFGKHNFYRGAHVKVYHQEVIDALEKLQDILPVDILATLWQESIKISESTQLSWLHGDVAVGNILVEDNNLTGIIDFGNLAIGDPSCDYVMAWTYFIKEQRDIFFETIGCSKEEILKARGWALWKALITYQDSDRYVAKTATYTIENILSEYKKEA